MMGARWFQGLRRRLRLAAEMDEELEFHRAARADHLVRQGVAPREAARRAAVEFGAAGHYAEECRAALGLRLLDELRSDMRYTLRGIRRSPGFFAASIGILALAIGANSVLFTLYNSFVVKPLAIPAPERHFDLNGRTAKGRQITSWTVAEMGALERGAADQVENLYSYSTFQVLMLKPAQRQVLVSVVSAPYFQRLDGRARLGRTFGAGEDRQPLAVLSDAGWRKLFGADPGVVGRTFRVRSTAYTIAGVMGPEFTGTEPVVPEFWVPDGVFPLLRPREGDAGDPRFGVSGFVRPGVSLEQAQAALSGTATHLERPEEDRAARVVLQPRVSLIPPNDDVRTASGLIFGAFLLVLVIACANLANLHLARAASRAQEIAMRLSLGASRWRIVRQLLTESACVGLLGAGGALALAGIGIREVQNYLFSSMMGVGIAFLPVTLDWRVFLFTALLGIAAGVVFGLLPAWRATNPRRAPRAGRMRNLLIGGQVASSLVLLILAGVLIRNIQILNAVEPGYDIDRVMDLKVDQPSAELMDRLARLDSVESVTAVAQMPLYGRLALHAAAVDGRSLALAYNLVDQRYFETLRLPVLEGRGFSRNEAETRARVAVVSAATARSLWPGAPALGKTVEVVAEEGDDARLPGRYQVIGVVPDVVSGWLFQGMDPSGVYLPAALGAPGVSSVMVRARSNPAAAALALRTACAEGASVGCEPASLRQVASLQRFPFQAAAVVAGVLGLLALLLTGVGLYGVVNYAVVQRRKEFGIHVALGAAPRQVMARMLAEAGRCIVGGLAAGLPLCLALSKLSASSVLGIRTFDPWSYAVVPVLLAAISLLACLGPARRAARVDPMRSLREE